ncbi:glycosyltransferase [Teredinibacter haidensis]|uniref:glycosyltransferase n=1 Tax=Teredinibacter haidensis TaxID=2731755 RepID=UPI000948EF62|nr:glycosyltransferase [Teredinibacter haidensis]
MKILWLSHLVPFPPKAGVLLRAYNLIKELSKYHSVHLLAFNQRSLIEPYFNSYEEGTDIAKKELEKYCEKVLFVDCPMDKSKFTKILCASKSLFTQYPYNINWLASSRYQSLANDLHKSENYDLIHCDTISLAPYIQAIDNCLLSLDHHNVESHMLFRRSGLEKNIFKKLYFQQEGRRLKRVEQELCPKFDINITCSNLDSERFLDFCPDGKFVDIPNGVDIDFFKPGKVSPCPIGIIFVGTLNWYPNIRAVNFIAQEIWPKLMLIVPNAEMNIIGANPPAELIRYASNNEHFHVHGYVDNINPYFDNAAIYLCPIDDGGGTKLKILDAFASGKAVVGHPVTFEGLNVVEGEHALFATTADDYIKQIMTLMQNPDLCQAIGDAARKHVVNNFSFESIGKKLADQFNQLPARESSLCAE